MLTRSTSLLPCSAKHTNPKPVYYFHAADDRTICFAGLWDYWESKDGKQSVTSCTVITTLPNDVVESVHDRMPAILHPRDYNAWLDPQYQDVDILHALLRPYEGNDLQTYRVSRLVNNADNNLRECILPLEKGACHHCAETKICYGCGGKGKARKRFSKSDDLAECLQCRGSGQCYTCQPKLPRGQQYLLWDK